MTERTQSQRSSQQTPSSMPADFRSLLIPIDLSPGSERVVERVALLPLAPNARLTLLHVVPKRLPREASGRVEADARKALSAAAESLGRRLPKGAVIEQAVKAGAPAAEIARSAKAVRAELIVMGRGGGRALRDIFLGSTAERVIRQGQLPVLVVRLPARAPYRRPLLALDVDEAAHHVLRLALRLIPPPRPRMSLVHAYDAPFDAMVYPSLSPERAEEYRRYYRQKAQHGIAGLLASAMAEAKATSRDDRVSWKNYIRHGSPRTVVQKTVEKAHADLLVLGTHGYAGVAHAFLGTVAGDVLRDVSCDVLVVPPRRPAARKT